jgi:hypothetical protein
MERSPVRDALGALSCSAILASAHASPPVSGGSAKSLRLRPRPAPALASGGGRRGDACAGSKDWQAAAYLVKFKLIPWRPQKFF